MLGSQPNTGTELVGGGPGGTIDSLTFANWGWRHEHREEVVETWKLDQRGRGWNFRTWNLKAWSLSNKKKKLESLNREKVYLDFRDLKSE